MSSNNVRALETGITFQHPTAFWIGSAAVATGVLSHLPQFFGASAMHYRMRDMALSEVMLTGMVLILGGLLLAAYGLIPLGRSADVEAKKTAGLHFHAMDSAHLTRAHWGLLFILGVALIVDVMKPATLGFIVPGMRAEYGLTKAMVAMYPL